MARKGQYTPRPGFARVPGPGRYYRDLKTGKRITRRQYLKRTEGITSTEAKAKRLRAEREKYGIPQPMTRYEKLVQQYKEKEGKGARVRGDSESAKRFQNAVKTLKRGRKKVRQVQWYGALLTLGIINQEQYDQSARMNQ